MNELPRQKFYEIIRRYGSDVYDDPSRFEGLIRDFEASTNNKISERNYNYPLSKDSSLSPKSNFLWILIAVSGLFGLTYILPGQIKNTPVQKTTAPSQLFDNHRLTSSSSTLPSSSLLPSPNTSVCAPDALLNEQIKDWRPPTINTLSKYIIIAAGHDGLNDIHKPGDPVLTISGDGTNGKLDKPVFYNLAERSLEGAVNLRIVPIIQTLLQQNGFIVTFVRAKQSENLRHKMERIKAMIANTDTFGFEIHFDDPIGDPKQSGSGVISPNIDPTLTANSTYADVATIVNLTGKGISGYDIALAREFGAYPQSWRNGLGGPRRGITLLEIDKITKIEPLFRKAIQTNDFSEVDEKLNQYAIKVANVFIKTYNDASQSVDGKTSTVCSKESSN
jgi:hypothetical protein